MRVAGVERSEPPAGRPWRARRGSLRSTPATRPGIVGVFDRAVCTPMRHRPARCATAGPIFPGGSVSRARRGRPEARRGHRPSRCRRSGGRCPGPRPPGGPSGRRRGGASTNSAALGSTAESRSRESSRSIRLSAASARRARPGRGRAGRGPAALPPAATSGRLDQDAAHRLGRGGEEVAAAVPGAVLAVADEPEICVVNQRRGVQRLPRPLAGQPGCGEPPEFVVDQREEVAGRRRVRPAVLPGPPRRTALGLVDHRRRVLSSISQPPPARGIRRLMDRSASESTARPGESHGPSPHGLGPFRARPPAPVRPPRIRRTRGHLFTMILGVL